MATPMSKQTDHSESQPIDALQRAGLRVTAQRLAVLKWLADQPHTTAGDIRSGVRGQLGAISVQAIYDVLTACVGAGLVRRIEPSGHAARFECRVGDNHHHLVCRACGNIEDVDCVVGARPCLTPVDDHDFIIDEAEVLLWGLCPRCQGKDESSTTSDKPVRARAP